MKWVRNLICFVLSVTLLFGCETNKNEVNHDTETTPASYVKEEIDIGEFYITSELVYEDGTIYAGGYDGDTPALLSYIVDTGEYETTPLDCDGEPEEIALCEDGVAYISRLEGESTGNAILHLPDGTEMQLAELIPALAGTWYRVNMISCDTSLYITGSYDCVELDTSGSILKRYTLDSQIYYLAAYSDNEFCCITQDNNGYKVYISDGDKPIESEEYTNLIIDYDMRELFSGNGELFVRGDKELIACNMESLSRRAIVDWVETGFHPSRVDSALYISDDLLFVYARDVVNNVPSLWRLTPGDADMGDRIEIKVSYYESGLNDVSDAILKFNVMQDKYYAVADELGEKRGEDSPLDVFDRMILTGEIGDVIIFPNSVEYEKYVAQKALVDLYDLMDSDENFSRELLLDCAYLPYETGESLFVLPRRFWLSTLVGKTKYFPDGITIDAFIDLTESGKTPLYDMSRNSVERVLLFAGVGDFIDTDNKSCNFTSEEFIRLLEFLKSLDTSSEILYDEQDITPYRNDEILLCEIGVLGNFAEYAKLLVRFGTDDFTVVGYPASEKALSDLSPRDILAVSAQSDKSDAAWEFIKFMISGSSLVDTEMGMMWIPALRSAMYDCAEAESKYSIVFKPNSTSYRTYDTTKEEIPENSGAVIQIDDEFVSDFERFIADIRIPSATEAKVREIISEELDAYYAGAKSAAETAEVIQNRVQLYLNE